MEEKERVGGKNHVKVDKVGEIEKGRMVRWRKIRRGKGKTNE